MPVTFDSFVKKESRSLDACVGTSNLFHRMVIDQLIRSKFVPASLADTLPSAAETAKFLSDQILSLHQQIVKDGSANLNERRLSFQAVCNHFLILLALDGRIESPQE